MIEAWAKNEAMFNVWMAQQLPQVKVLSAVAKPAGDGVFDVTVEVTNEGLMPTALEIAKRVKMVRPDTVAIELADGQSIVRAAAPGAAGGRGGAPQGMGRGGRGGQPGAPQAAQRRASEDIGWLKAGETKTVTFKVKGTGSAKVTIGSTRGGVDTTTVDIK